jgi:hypothetical protein
MRPHCYTAIWTLLILASGYSLHAQADTTKYKERAAIVDQGVWAWNVPAFNNYKVPAQYANESSVIMARRAEIQANSKSKLGAGFRINRNFYYNSTVRELVKINDKVSLDEYSQLSYRQFKKLNRWMSATATTFVGARIIKPDGSVKHVGIDETVLLQTPGDGPERKLAISGLEVGDFLDMYICVEEYSVNFREPERLIFEFGEEHPILDYSIHCNIGDKYAVEYRSMNHAPDAQQTTNDDKDLILDINMKNLAAVPTGLWMSSLRELPAFRINVLAGNKEVTGRSTGEVIKDVPLLDVLNRTWPETNPALNMVVGNTVHKVLIDYDSHFKRIPKDSLARLIYYAYRFSLYYNQLEESKSMEVGESRNHMELNTSLYLSCLRALLDSYDVDAEFTVMPSRYGPSINDIMAPGDMMLMLKVNVDKPFFVSCGNMFTCLDYVPDYLEGQPYVELNRAFRKSQLPDMDISTPITAAEENVHKENLQVDIAPDMQLLHIKRQTTLTGKMKEDEQLHLLNFEDCYNSEQQALHVEKSVMDELKKARRKNNVSEDYAAALQKARASLKDRFKEEVTSEFIEDPKEMLAWKIDNPGIRDYAPDFVYSTEFTMDGLLQRAGNNLLLSVGKAINSPLKMTASQRDRKVDIYMPYARTLDCSVSFTIPQGYTVMGVDKLNGKVSNGCGSVTTTARIQGNQLIIQYKRVYKHNFEGVAKWPELLAIIDAGNDFSGQKVLLKKG